MEKTNKKNYCVILAGGRGQRLWPVSREQRPKQFLDLFGTGRTLLQSTFDRFERLLPIENIYICTCAEYHDLVREQLPEIADCNIIVEPIHRNTAPSVAWASMRIHHIDPEANIIVSPSDQLVLKAVVLYHRKRSVRADFKDRANAVVNSVHYDFLIVNCVLVDKKIAVVNAVLADNKGARLAAHKANVFSVVVAAQVRPFHQRIILASRIHKLRVGREQGRTKNKKRAKANRRAHRLISFKHFHSWNAKRPCRRT